MPLLRGIALMDEKEKDLLGRLITIMCIFKNAFPDPNLTIQKVIDFAEATRRGTGEAPFGFCGYQNDVPCKGKENQP